MRNRIYLETETDCMEFCNAACLVTGKVELVNATGRYRINAKSVLGCLMASAGYPGRGFRPRSQRKRTGSPAIFPSSRWQRRNR